MKKKIIKYNLILLIFNLMIYSVKAQVTYRALQPFWNLIAYIFNILPNGVTRYAFFKFIIWLLLATVLIVLVPKALQFLKSDDETTKKQAKIVAWILSLMMSIGIPNKVLDLIFNSYSFIGAFLLVAVGPAIVFTLTNKSNRRLRGLAFLFSGLLLIIFSNAGTSAGWFNLLDLLDWLNAGGLIMMIIGLVMIIQGDDNNNQNTQQQTSTQAAQPQPQSVNLQQFQQNYQELQQNLQAFNNSLQQFKSSIIGISQEGQLTQQQRQNVINTAKSVYKAANAITPLIISLQFNNQLFQQLQPNPEAQFNQYVKNYLENYNDFIYFFSLIAQRF